MRLTKKQSFLVAAAILGLFFLVGTVFLKTNSRTMRITELNSEHPAHGAAEATIAPPPILTLAPLQITPNGENAATGVFTMNEFHRSEVRDGRKLWEVHGVQAQYFPESNSVRISNADLAMQAKNGKETQLKTKQATLYMSGPALAKAHLEQGVTVVYNNEYTLISDEAICDRVANTVVIPKAVTITGAAMDIKGDKLEGSIDSQVFTVSGNVETTIKPRVKGEKVLP